MLLSVKVKTNAKKNEVMCIGDGLFVVRTTVTPENGKANKCVIDLLSQYFRVPKGCISIIKGSLSHHKIIDIKQ